MTIDDSCHFEYLERFLNDLSQGYSEVDVPDRAEIAQRSLGVLKVKYGWLEDRAEEFSRAVVSWKENEELDAAEIERLTTIVHRLSDERQRLREH